MEIRFDGILLDFNRILFLSLLLGFSKGKPCISNFKDEGNTENLIKLCEDLRVQISPCGFVESAYQFS